MSKRAAAPQPPGYRESGKKPSLPTIQWQSHQTARAIFLKEALEADGKMVTSTALLDLDSMLPGSCLQEFVKYKNKVADKLSNIGRSQATQAKRQQKSEALMKLALKKTVRSNQIPATAPALFLAAVAAAAVAAAAAALAHTFGMRQLV